MGAESSLRDLPIDSPTALTAPEHVLTRKVANETVLLSLESEEYFGLDHVGNRVWELIEQETPFAIMVSTIAAEYSADPEEVAADLRELIGDLVEANLVAQAGAL